MSSGGNRPWCRGCAPPSFRHHRSCGTRRPPRCRPTALPAFFRGLTTSECKISPPPPGVPVWPRRMIAQARHMFPGQAVIVAPEQPCRLHAGIEPPIAMARQAPHRFDRIFARLIGKALARMRPCRAEIAGLPHGRSEPLVSAPGIESAALLIGDDMVHRPIARSRPAEAANDRRVASPSRRSRPLGSDEDEHALVHDQLLPVAVCLGQLASVPDYSDL